MDNKNQKLDDELVQKVEELDRVIEEQPLEAMNYFKRGQIKNKLGDKGGALIDFDRFIDLMEKNAVLFNNRVDIRDDLGERDVVLLDYEKVKEIHEFLAKTYNARGNIKGDLGDKEGALKDYDKAIELNENYFTAYNNRAICKTDLGDTEGALTDYGKAIELSNNYHSAYYNRGSLKRLLGDMEGALVDCDKAIVLQEGDFMSYNCRGDVKYFLGDMEGALADYDKAIYLCDNNSSIYNNRALVKRILGNIEGALADYDRAIEISESIYSYNNRGLLKRDMVNYESFLILFDSQPQDIEIEASILEKKKKIKSNLESSIADFKKAIELNSQSNNLVNNNLRNTEEMLSHFEFETSLNPQTHEGFLVFADIMGWKGIWQKKDFNENTTLKTMLRIKRRLLKIETDFELKVNLISDTFVIFSNQLELISNACRILIESCLESNLLIRGAMAYGTYYNLETVYVGPTVDEAASWHEKAEEVVIMCTTSARREIEKSDSNALKKAGMVEREVSTKQGKIKTFVVDWYTEENKSNFLNIMDSTQVYPELYYKYSNTEKALNEILDKKSKSEISLENNEKITV